MITLKYGWSLVIEAAGFWSRGYWGDCPYFHAKELGTGIPGSRTYLKQRCFGYSLPFVISQKYSAKLIVLW